MRRSLKYLYLTAVCLLPGSIGAARAEDTPPAATPFDLTSTKWLPVNRPAPAAAPVAAPADTPVAKAQPDTGGEAHVTEVAPPTRMLHMPVMPGMASYTLDVSSTAQNASANAQKPAPAQQADDASPTPDAPLPAQNWQKAAEAARKFAITSAKANGDQAPLNIRPSYLPNEKVTLAAAPVTVEHPHVKRLPVVPLAGAAKKSSKTNDMAACAAIGDFKKKQLEALQSDRETLAALQNAIAQLGLERQLGYLTGQPAQTSQQAAAQSLPEAADKGRP